MLPMLRKQAQEGFRRGVYGVLIWLTTVRIGWPKLISFFSRNIFSVASSGERDAFPSWPRAQVMQMQRSPVCRARTQLGMFYPPQFSE